MTQPSNESRLSSEDSRRIGEMYSDIKHLIAQYKTHNETHIALEHRLDEHSKEIHTAKAGIGMLRWVFGGGVALLMLKDFFKTLLKGLF